ncbi:MAG TPA: glycosyltransferase family A protein [Rhizomicrobium sp.]|jgi:chlorobactene glucosyltransferase|nr:glycosyltransferase family A protein [Rhizomicrobium sp.]
MPWLLALSVGWLAGVALLILRAVLQRNHLGRLDVSDRIDPASAPPLAVIVPARDEAANIGSCLRSLLAQHYPPDRVTVWVVDDGSRDGTPDIVQRMARTGKRLELMKSPTLPQGWTGKSHACWLAARSVPGDVQWLCFIDADMRTEPRLLATAVSCAIRDNLSLLSLAPRHELKTFAERLMIPCGLCFLGFRQDLRGALPEYGDGVIATGQFFLARRDAYEALGGHAAVCSEICEDLELARLFKSRGARVCLKDASDLLSTRMYTGWSTLWPGFAKNLTELLGGPGQAIGAALASVVLAWAAVFLPVLDGAACRAGSTSACVALVPALMASAAMLALHIACAVHLGIPFWYGCLFPFAYTIGSVMALDSVRWRLRGRVNWKGRQYLRPRARPGRL